jgi:hypothetical protein
MSPKSSDRSWIATKKGLFESRLHGRVWGIERISFLGEPVTMLLPPPAGDTRMLALLTTGHCGTQLHASDDAGQTWHQGATPTCPAQPEGAEGSAWKLMQLWSLEPSRRMARSGPARCRAGCSARPPSAAVDGWSKVCGNARNISIGSAAPGSRVTMALVVPCHRLA